VKVDDVCTRVRAKNAGPFRLTIDCFCASVGDWQRLLDGLSAERVGQALGAGAGTVTRHELAELRVIKFSLPRPGVQGALGDRDQHGAQWALVIVALNLDVQLVAPG